MRDIYHLLVQFFQLCLLSLAFVYLTTPVVDVLFNLRSVVLGFFLHPARNCLDMQLLQKQSLHQLLFPVQVIALPILPFNLQIKIPEFS